MAITNGTELVEAVRHWPGVSLQPHRFGSTEFVVNGKEIGHMHGVSLVDLMLSKAARDEALRLGKAAPHHVLRNRTGYRFICARKRTSAARSNCFDSGMTNWFLRRERETVRIR